MRTTDRRQRGARSPSVLLRYLLLQVPSWLLAGLIAAGLHRWLGLSGWLAAAVVVGWVAKDLALYPWLRASYRVDPRTPAERQLLGEHAIVVQPLTPRGYVRLRGELWQAETTGGHLGAGTSVEVVSVESLRLVVRPRV